ncbi:hypothetical protein CcaverHIS631_0403720 [Cutaneotrichosporon cavernicola]|nr:hypothetical protein CcaverHIS631_0403720 [Cutaneotrichosporon cavernicola]
MAGPHPDRDEARINAPPKAQFKVEIKAEIMPELEAMLEARVKAGFDAMFERVEARIDEIDAKNERVRSWWNLISPIWHPELRYVAVVGLEGARAGTAT